MFWYAFLFWRMRLTYQFGQALIGIWVVWVDGAPDAHQDILDVEMRCQCEFSCVVAATSAVLGPIRAVHSLSCFWTEVNNDVNRSDTFCIIVLRAGIVAHVAGVWRSRCKMHELVGCRCRSLAHIPLAKALIQEVILSFLFVRTNSKI
jgi:hypothetical protein